MVSHIVIPIIIIAIVIAALVLTGEYANPIVAIPSMAIVGFISYRISYVIYKTRKRNLYTYVGKIGKAVEDIPLNGEGYVIIEGEMWKAIAEEPIVEGDRVIVTGMEGLKLRVKKLTSDGKN
ncbi:NfeD family protein [Sulfurisphaera ohwakuensis]|uniref:Membrane protein implicated in regulation of membrane protease activity n=1 Tax=Sulfurisphaera ohwakuensis TaxID=69656 RepID=A0A650CJ89_SULOH|nr:NfeD family protein [Sulfurisphaera ohwakuensis]MBB5253952.1 membrane protein implicated in regulation of membrane protease activity [Sulfurisphaera ohwakuensis]QGR17839.1 NfeD family protein [Sulfurisphaera ohwakuensis]